MSVYEWLLRKTSIHGSTARWAAVNYLIKHPRSSVIDHGILKEMVAQRYRVIPHRDAERGLLNAMPKVRTLADLVVAVLLAEDKRPGSYVDYLEFAEVIKKELLAKGVPTALTELSSMDDLSEMDGLIAECRAE